MSDENTGTSVPAQASSAEQTIPKVRLDEEIQRRRLLEEQVKFQQQMLQGMQQRQQAPQQPSVEQERLRRLKEENPELYKAEVEKYRLKQELNQTKQAVAGLWDEQDRIKLVNRYGKLAEKRLGEVEQTLEQFRASGNFNINREQVLVLLMGQDKLKEESTPKAVPAPTAQAQATAQPTDDDIPSTDARFASTLAGGKAPSSGSNKSFTEIEKELETVEF